MHKNWLLIDEGEIDNSSADLEQRKYGTAYPIHSIRCAWIRELQCVILNCCGDKLQLFWICWSNWFCIWMRYIQLNNKVIRSENHLFVLELWVCVSVDLRLGNYSEFQCEICKFIRGACELAGTWAILVRVRLMCFVQQFACIHSEFIQETFDVQYKFCVYVCV